MTMKTMITKNNYEAYVLDWIEGTLSEMDSQAFDAFLKKHPEIAAELDSFEIITLPKPEENVVYPHKKALLKEETKPTYVVFQRRQWLVAASIALLIGALFFTFSSDKQSALPQQVAETETNEQLPKNHIEPQKRTTEENVIEVASEEIKSQQSNSSKTEAKNPSTPLEATRGTIDPKPLRNQFAVAKTTQGKSKNQGIQQPSMNPKKQEVVRGPILITREEIAIDHLADRPLQQLLSKDITPEIMSDVDLSIALAQDMQRRKLLDPDIRDMALLQNSSLEKYMGKVTLANTTASFIPSYFKEILENREN